jgi:uncharacterized protein with gpF-like domain
MTSIKRRNPKANLLPPVRPSLGLAAIYKRRLTAMIDDMHKSIDYWLRAAYKKNEPIMAQDELPAEALRKAVRDLARRWQKNFDAMAPELAAYFAKAAHRRSDAQLKSILRRGGISVRWTMTKAQQDILAATVAENVALIKSIPQQFMTQVEGSVMRSVQTGRDLGTLSKELEQHYEVTKRRAAFISLDQNNKIMGALQRARQLELGITQAVWLHSHGGKVPRPTHLANSGKKYDVAKGWFDPDPKVQQFIIPGELKNCRCVAKPVIPGLS